MNRSNIGLCTNEIDLCPVLGNANPVEENLTETINYKKAVSCLRDLLQDVNDLKKGYVSLGFHLLKYDRLSYWLTLGFSNIFEFAESNLGLDKTSVSRCMSVARIFSSDSRYVQLDKKYEDYSYSQLCEMVSMNESDRCKVKPEMTIKQIRELKKAAKETDCDRQDVNYIDSLKDILSGKKSIQEFDRQMKEKYHPDQEQAEQVPGQTSIEQDFPEYLPGEQKKPVATSQRKKKEKPFNVLEYGKLEGAARLAYIKSRDRLKNDGFVSVRFFDSNGEEICLEVFGVYGEVIYHSCNDYFVRMYKTREELVKDYESRKAVL